MKEMKINEFLSLKLEEGKTHIYIKGKKFRQCKRLVINIPKQSIPMFDDIDSIDEAANLHQKYLYQNKIVEGPNARVLRDEIHDITPEQEFWGHCSNLQAWNEHNYDTRLIHSNLAFPLLKALIDAGDPNAKRVFKTEVAERFESGYPNAIIYIIASRLLDYFSLEEKRQLLQDNVPAILSYIERVSKNFPSMFLFIFEEKIVDYLNPEEKTQLIELNYQLILKWLQKISKSRYFPKKRLYYFKDIIIDYLSEEDIKRLIQHFFPVIIKGIKKIGKHYPNLFLYLFEERLLRYLSNVEKIQLIQENYYVIFSYIQKTSKQDPDTFFYIFVAGILDLLLPEVRRKILQENFEIIFKNWHKLLKSTLADQLEFYYPRTILVIFEERLFDYLTPEEKKELICQNFPALLGYIKSMTGDFDGARFLRNSSSKYRISEKTICYLYLTVINAIEGTKLLDDFFKAIVEVSYYSLDVIMKAINSIKKEEELNQSKSVKATEVGTQNETSTDNWREVFDSFMKPWMAKQDQKIKRDNEIKRIKEIKLNQELKSIRDGIACNKCGHLLPAKSMDILIGKERVYCPFCGIINKRKFSFETQMAYLEAKKNEPRHLEREFGKFIDGGKIRCPMCGAVERDIKKIEDKSKVMYYVSIVPRYAKKHVCKKCGYEF